MTWTDAHHDAHRQSTLENCGFKANKRDEAKGENRDDISCEPNWARLLYLITWQGEYAPFPGVHDSCASVNPYVTAAIIRSQ